MSFNLKEELLKLSNTAPALRDSDEELDYDITKAKVDAKSNGEFNDDLDISYSDNKRIRASIGGLEDIGTRYKGKKISRNQIIDEMNNEDSDDINLHLSEDDDEDDEDDDDNEVEEPELDEEESEVEEDDDGEDDGDEDGEDDGEVNGVSKKSKKPVDDKEPELNIMNNNWKDEVEKGKAVKKQLEFWEILLETRVKLQNVLSTVNQFPQLDTYETVLNSLKPEMKKNTQEILNENKKTLLKLMNQSIELQQLMFSTEKDCSYLVDTGNEKNHLKRKAGSEESETDEEDNEDDEEIYSDTDEEFQANQGAKKAKINPESNKSSLKEITIKHFKPELIEGHLDKVNKNFAKYKNGIIQKWYDKTRLTSGKSFESFDKPILQQIDHILTDRDRLIKRTQLKRTVFKICGKEEKKVTNPEDLNDRHINDYDTEIFDDNDFYNQLMRELIDRKTSNIVDPAELSRKSIELQKLRTKNKKVVDTKASKGRKIKFTVHKPMVNFMAPIYRNQLPEEGRNELFRSLFGNHMTMGTSNSEANLKSGIEADLGFQDLFKMI